MMPRRYLSSGRPLREILDAPSTPAGPQGGRAVWGEGAPSPAPADR